MARRTTPTGSLQAAVNHRAMLSKFRLGRVWDTADPFLFCVHHNDDYPRGDANMCPEQKELQGNHSILQA